MVRKNFPAVITGPCRHKEFTRLSEISIRSLEMYNIAAY